MKRIHEEVCLLIGLEGSVLRSKRFKGPYPCQPTSTNFKDVEIEDNQEDIVMFAGKSIEEAC